jgi:hypothetical protein
MTQEDKELLEINSITTKTSNNHGLSNIEIELSDGTSYSTSSPAKTEKEYRMILTDFDVHKIKIQSAWAEESAHWPNGFTFESRGSSPEKLDVCKNLQRNAAVSKHHHPYAELTPK